MPGGGPKDRGAGEEGFGIIKKLEIGLFFLCFLRFLKPKNHEKNASKW